MKKTRSNTKGIGPKHVEQDMADNLLSKDMNLSELSGLIRNIIREEIQAAMDKLQPQLDAVKKDISACSGKVAVLEETMNHMESRVTALETANESLRKENQELKEKADRMENQSRRFNIRILGVTPDAEKGNPTSFVSALLKDVFKDKLPRAPEVEIAHRVGPLGKSGPRVMIVRLHRLETRENIVRIAKKEKVLEFRGMKLRIFPDLTAETVRARAKFREVKNKLWSAGVKHGIIHPSTLILTYKGETVKFSDHLSAERFLKTVIEPEMQNQESEH